MSNAQGEDRSDYQPVLPPVDRNGRKLDFVWYKATEGTGWTSAVYAQNIALAKEHGVPFGSYHFLHPSLDVERQVSLFMNFVGEHGGIEPGAMFAADSEIASGADGDLVLFSDRSRLLQRIGDGKVAVNMAARAHYPHRLMSGTPSKISGSQVDLATLAFLRGVRARVVSWLGGDYCQELVYSFLDMLPQLSSCVDYPLWAAYFAPSAPLSVRPWHDWALWQFAGGGGNGGSDQDAYCGDAAAFNAWRLSKIPTGPKMSTFPVSLPELALGSEDHAGQVEYVRRLQWLLAGVGEANNLAWARGLVATGVFDAQTELAVRSVQEFAKLATNSSVATGTVGIAEWRFLLNGVRGRA